MGFVVELVVVGRGCMCLHEMSMFPLCSPAVIVPNDCMMIGMSMYTQQFVSRMDPVVDAAPETLLFRGATLGIMNLWNQSFGQRANSFSKKKDRRHSRRQMDVGECTKHRGEYWKRKS